MVHPLENIKLTSHEVHQKFVVVDEISLYYLNSNVLIGCSILTLSYLTEGAFADECANFVSFTNAIYLFETLVLFDAQNLPRFQILLLLLHLSEQLLICLYLNCYFLAIDIVGLIQKVNWSAVGVLLVYVTSSARMMFFRLFSNLRQRVVLIGCFHLHCANFYHAL